MATKAPPGQTDNLAELDNLTEGTLLNELKVRHNKDVIYTYVGEILVATNPYKWIQGLYDESQSKAYHRISSKSDASPHIFAVSDIAFHQMIQAGENQVCVISGESGAGKTETAKLFVKQLIHCSSGSEVEGLHHKLVQVNPVLEAFGNAQTLMNDNSSRFGKFTEVLFTPEGKIRGANMKDYLLEKSRVVHQADGERNFHVFYLTFSGLSADEKADLALTDPRDYRYIDANPDALDDITSERMTGLKKELVECFDIVGFTSAERENLFAVLSGILHLGNVEFEGDDQAIITSDKRIMDAVCAQLGIDETTLEHAMTKSITIIRGEETERFYKAFEAEDCRDAAAKALYEKLFHWIVSRVNELLGVRESEKKRTDKNIGILDIFGFECFDENSFEQMCINLANEQLQFFFNNHIFAMELAEYAKEGIDGTDISYEDNQPLLDLLLATKPLGMLAILDEESNFPKASDHTMIEKFHAAFTKHKDYERPRGNDDYFTLRHYAGKVRYEGYGYLEKNRDTLAVDVVGALRVSENDLVKLMFVSDEEKKGKAVGAKRGRGRGPKMDRKASQARMRQSIKHARASLAKKKKVTVASHFKKSLSDLIIQLSSAEPHFVRTVKPNTHKEKNLFEDELVSKQLRYCGMLETTRIRREGFAARPLFADFLKRYEVLAWGNPNIAANGAGCRAILERAGIEGFRIGKTKVFMRYWHVDELNAKIAPILDAARNIQKFARGCLARKKVGKLMAASTAQAKKVASFLSSAERSGSTTRDVLSDLCAEDDKRPSDFWSKPQAAAPAPAKMNTAKRKGMQRAASVRWFKETEKEKGNGMTEDGGFQDWFHGLISRHQAEDLLRGQKTTTFLVRVAESRFGYSLSLVFNDRLKHFMIDVKSDTNEYQVVGNDRMFASLNELVAHHKRHPVTNDGDTLDYSCPVDGERHDLNELH